LLGLTGTREHGHELIHHYVGEKVAAEGMSAGKQVQAVTHSTKAAGWEGLLSVTAGLLQTGSSKREGCQEVIPSD